MRSSRFAAVLLALGAALGVSACGGSGNSSHTGPTTVTKTQVVTVTTTGGTGTATTGTGTTPATTTATSTATTGASTTGTSTTGTRTTAGGHCVAGDLTPVSQSTNGAAGTIVWEVALKNTSSSSCDTEGFPGAEFLNASGQPIGKPAVRTTSSAAGGTVQPSAITLAPGASAYFDIQVDDAAGGGAGCTGVSQLQIYAPDDTAAMKLKAPSELQYCPKLTVTPLQSRP